MIPLPPWARGPFELLVHAELHLQNGEDFDRRMAMISFDNAIEVAITTYLSLNPIQRGGRTYTQANVDIWLDNYHTKLDFFISELAARNLPVTHTKANIVWYHDVRNGQYHGKGGTVPEASDLQGIRGAALWVFSVLFDVSDAEKLLLDRVSELDTDTLPKRSDETDRLIDSECPMVEIGGKQYYASEAMYGIDPVTYSELAKDLQDARDAAEKENPPK